MTTRKQIEFYPAWIEANPEIYLNKLHKFHQETHGWRKFVQDHPYLKIFVAINPESDDGKQEALM